MSNIKIIEINDHPVTAVFAKLRDGDDIFNTIESLKINCTDNELIEKYICICYNNKNIELLKHKYIYITFIDNSPHIPNIIDILQLIGNNKNILYVSDEWIFTIKNNYIINSNKILNTENNIGQIIFSDYSYSNFTKKKLADHNITIPTIIPYNFDDPHYKFNMINFVVKQNHINPFTKIYNYTCNFTENINHIANNWPYFQLLPSIIKLTCFNTYNYNNLPTNFISQRYIVEQYYYNNFISCYVNTPLKYISCECSDDVTIVTAYINTGRGQKKKKYDYIEKSYPTLSIKQKMVIFVSEDLQEHVMEIRRKYNLLDNHTKIIVLTISDLYMYENINKVSSCSDKNIPPYDNPLYILSVNSRYKYVDQAIKNNYFNTKYFAWIDFGISHIVTIPDNFKISCYNNNKVRIGFAARHTGNRFTYNCLAMTGGLFSGNIHALKELIKIHDFEFQKLIDFGYCVNDDKLLFLIFCKYSVLFDYYFTSYGCMAIKYNK